MVIQHQKKTSDPKALTLGGGCVVDPEGLGALAGRGCARGCGWVCGGNGDVFRAFMGSLKIATHHEEKIY